mgnify:CR=1 FL=1
MKQVFCILAILLITSGPSCASVKQLHIGISTGYPPFYFFDENNQPTGICIDVINQVARLMNISVRYDSYPWKRMLHNGKAGVVDAILPLFKTDERKQFLFFPETELVSEDNSFFTAKSNPLVYSGRLTDMIGSSIGVLDTYSYGEEFDRINFAQKTIAKTPEQLISLVRHGRVELGIGNSKVITYTAKKITAANHIRFLSPPVTVNPLYVGFSKQKIGPDFVRRFNDQLRKFKETPKYREIIKQYGL